MDQPSHLVGDSRSVPAATKRLNRAQSRNQTRERLLSAARTIFLKKGCAAASVEDIAVEAGHTRGAFYSNFRSKTELFVELLERDHDEAMAELERIFTAGGTRDEVERKVLAYYRQRYRRHETFLMWTEAKLQAARDVRFRTPFNAFMRKRQERTTACIRAFAERTRAPLRLPAEVLALGLMELCDGVQSRYAVDPQCVTNALADAVLAGFFACTVFDRVPE
ncbi:TetR/AcrR family transcriptional regulator [Burkholderia ubonensis]|uniref:TetR family transcriptional regulator n=1 Tax=Burkholderia ubonensis subsp. mesacidophila TaxID=265293 RepID=A0A2A4FDH3_9BURK|nr:TetR/AcrR family transcriptional regulator [Burkholderia ubonensis]PCE30476.1 TetR family transcriptional regulator [Burkholderia ubonensis subsp. mesacidophila]